MVPVLEKKWAFQQHVIFSYVIEEVQTSANITKIRAMCSGRNKIIFTFCLEIGMQRYFSNAVD